MRGAVAVSKKIGVSCLHQDRTHVRTHIQKNASPVATPSTLKVPYLEVYSTQTMGLWGRQNEDADDFGARVLG